MPVISSPIRSPIRSPIYSPLTGKWGSTDVLTPQVVAMFSGGEKGVVYDFTDTTKMFTTSAGSTNATTLGDTIGRVVDLSPNAANATEIDSANSRLPTLGTRNGVKFAHGDGWATRLRTAAAVDLSGSAVYTVVLGAVKTGDVIASYIASNLNGGGPSGGFAINAVDAANGKRLIFQGRGTAGYDGYYTDAQAPFKLVSSCVYNFPGAALATRVFPRLNGAIPTLAAGNVSGQGTVGANQIVNLFSDSAGANSKVDLFRFMIIARQLTAAEILVAEAWAGAPIPALGAVNALVIGDSTVTGSYNTLPIPYFIPRLASNIIATYGETIAQQQARFDGTTSYTKYGVIFVQVGLNDLNPATATATTISALQALITDINAKKAAGTKVIIGQMNPCKGSLTAAYGAPNVAAAYQKWIDMNDAIAGNGATPITGVDARIISPPALNDGAGNLAAQYDVGGGIHPNNAGRQLEAIAWDAALTSVGL